MRDWRWTPITPILLPLKARNGRRPALSIESAMTRPPAIAHCADRVVDSVNVVKDGTGFHPFAFCRADAELRLAGVNVPAFRALKAHYADMLGGAAPGMPPDRGMELELETGDAPMRRSRPVKCLIYGERAEVRAQLIDLRDRGRIRHSTAPPLRAIRRRRRGGVLPQAWLVTAPWLRLRGPQRHHAAGSRGAPAPSPSLIWPAAYHQLRVLAAHQWKSGGPG